MIFVTVGTHEQSFNRLVKYMDLWAGLHDEEVVMQVGFTDYEPKSCSWQKLFSYDDMTANIAKARIVVTHGGPSSFIPVIQSGKTPIVVPRRSEFHEHVNNHQLMFCRELMIRSGSIILIEDIEELGIAIEKYNATDQSCLFRSHNAVFCQGLESIVDELFGR